MDPDVLILDPQHCSVVEPGHFRLVRPGFDLLEIGIKNRSKINTLLNKNRLW